MNREANEGSSVDAEVKPAEPVEGAPEDGEVEPAEPVEDVVSTELLFEQARQQLANDVGPVPRRGERTTCFYKAISIARHGRPQGKLCIDALSFAKVGRGKLVFTIASMAYAAVGLHTCHIEAIANVVINVEDQMKAQADLLSIEHVAWPVRQVWEELRHQFYSADNPNVARGLSEQQVVRRVHRARSAHYSINVHGSIEIPPLSLALDEELSFFQFHYVTINRDDLNKPSRLLGWAHPSLVALLRYHGYRVVCGWHFSGCPAGFRTVRCVHGPRPSLWSVVPVFYILSTSRTGDAYWDMIHFIVESTDQQLEPAEIVCDFEAPLMDALQTQFPNAFVLECLFHLKQALRRAMKRYAIPEDECLIAMTRGVLDTLTVIDPAHVERGIKWVKREIKLRCAQAGVTYSTEKWADFWGYFIRTWLEQYTIDVWNVFGMNNELVARMNNPLERFNREHNTRFPTPHPSMATFVTVIKAISAEYVRRVADVPRGRARRVPREVIQLPQVMDISSDVDSDVDPPLEEPEAVASPAADGSTLTSATL